MMYRILVLILIINPFNCNYAYANSKDILILYEQVYNGEKEYNSIEVIKRQLLNYSNHVDTVQLDSYMKSTIDKYDYIFVINIENKINNTDVITDLMNSNKDIYWIGDGIQNLINITKKYSIEYTNKDSIISKVINDKWTEIVEENSMHNIIECTTNKTKIIASMTDGYNKYPYIINEQNLFYIVDSDIKDNYMFLDSLNYVFGVGNGKQPEVIFALDNIEHFKDDEKFNQLVECLNYNNVPFTNKFQIIDEYNADIDQLKYRLNIISKIKNYKAAILINNKFDVESLEEVISIIKENNINVIDLETLNKDINNISVISHDNSIPIEFKSEKENTQEIPNEQILYKQRMKTINKVVVIFIVVIIAVFSMIYFKFREINKNKFKIDKDKN